MSKKILGIDIGITSVGWGVINENFDIIDTGVRLFEEAVSTNNQDRREARGARRTLRRKKGRVLALKNLLKANGIIDENFKHLSNPYHIRVKGLTEKLTNEELATALLHIAKRRGSSLEIVETESTNELSPKVILRDNEEELKKFKTVGQVQLNRLKTTGSVRGTNNVFKTEDYIKEVKLILEKQNLPKELQKEIINIISRKRHYSEGPGSKNFPTEYGRYRKVDEDLEKELLREIKNKYNDLYLKEIFEFDYKDKKYRVLKSGKIINAKPYSLIDLMRGKCSIYEEELRAPRLSFSAELHNLLNDLNNLKFIKEENRKITKEEKEKIISHLKEKGRFSPNNINGVLKIIGYKTEDVIGYRIDNKSKPDITIFKGYPKVLKIYKDNNEKISDYKIIDKIAEILSIYQTEEERIEKLSEIITNEEIVKELSLLTGFKEFHGFSFKALNLLNKEMLVESKNQQEIITEKNLRKPQEIKRLVIDDSAILSPVAKRAHREALKVIEELIKEHGTFHRIVIETTRDKNSAEQRRNITRANNRNKKRKEMAEELLKDSGYNIDSNISGSLVNKIIMYQEQNGKCAYTGKEINLGQLIRDPKAYEIDHIIPYSISLDNSQNNKVLVTPLANQRKSNLTPYGYFKSGKIVEDSKIKSFEEFETIVLNNNNYSPHKKANLLFMEDINKHNVVKQFINRNLVDTSYAARSLLTTLKNYFEYNNINTIVTTIKGKQTNLFRHLGIREWNKKNPNNYEENPLVKDRDKYIHHAIDALIIAGLSEQKSIRWLHHIDKIENDEETIIYNKHTGEIIENDPTNDSDIIKFLLKIAEIKDEDVKYSWKIDTKPNRQIADATIYSTRMIDGEEYYIGKYDIDEISNAKRFQDIFIGDKGNLLLMYHHDRKTYDKLSKIYEHYKSFDNPFLKYREENGDITKYSKKDKGPKINQIKYILGKRTINDIELKTNSKNKSVVLRSLKPYRVDFYWNGQRYKHVIVHYADLREKNGKYEVVKEIYNQKLKENKIDENYRFALSFYRNNLIELTWSTGEKLFGRFVGSTGNRIEIKSTNLVDPVETRSRRRPTITSKIQKIRKFHVSMTGKMHEVKKEDLQLRI